MWFDAHPDFNTPDECTGGYFDCIGVSTLAGESWKALAASIPGFSPLDLSHLVCCGIRDFEPGQREKVEAHGVRAVYGSTSSRPRFSEELAIHLDAVSGPKLIHLDLDALDTSVGQANEYAAPGGLSANDLRACPELTVARSPPAAMTIASFNPDLEGSDAIAAAAIRAALSVAQAIV